MTFAALRLPAGKFKPIFSSLSRKDLPPFFDLALLSTPPRRDAFRHSGGERRLWTSPTVTLYFEVELSKDKRPGTEQNTSPVLTEIPPRKPSLFIIKEVTDFGGTGTFLMTDWSNKFIPLLLASSTDWTSSIPGCPMPCRERLSPMPESRPW